MSHVVLTNNSCILRSLTCCVCAWCGFFFLKQQNPSKATSWKKKRQSWWKFLWQQKSFQNRSQEKKKRNEEKSSYFVQSSCKKVFILKHQLVFESLKKAKSQFSFSVLWPFGQLSSNPCREQSSCRMSKIFFSEKSLKPQLSSPQAFFYLKQPWGPLESVFWMNPPQNNRKVKTHYMLLRKL